MTCRNGYAGRVSALAPFSQDVRTWFEQTFAGPTPAQERGWPAIATGRHVLIQAPTGSGKTLAAFLWALDRARPGEGTQVLYVSPLKALNYDVERNLRGPLAGIRSELSVAVRTGDTPPKERAAMLKRPPDILITTPESLFLMLTSRARDTLRGVQVVIVDEVHAVAGSKRGAHLALSLERLERLVGGPMQRVGLSATQRPLEEIGRFVSGGRPIELVDAGTRKELDLRVVVPLEDMREPGEGGSIWPSIYPALLELVREHRSTIVFVNNRRLAERLALRLNELAEQEIARAHHGSLAREQRVEVEEQLKKGDIPCLVATSSLELGIDMGAVDLVVQVESPKSVARGLQRVGRAGHRLDEASKGRIFPKFRADLLESAVVVRRMKEGLIEETRVPRNPLDVLAQQVVAVCAQEEISVDELHDLVRRAWPFRDLSRQQLENVLDMLAGRYPSEEFARAATAHHLGSGRRAPAGPRRRSPARGHERRHDPRPRPLRRLPRGGRRARRRARRGDGLRGTGRPDVPARRLDMADRGDHPRPRARLAGAGRSRASCPSGRARASAVRTSSVKRSGRPAGSLSASTTSVPASDWCPSTSSTSAPRRTSSRSSASRSRRPACFLPIERSSSSASATRSATGGSAS